MNLTTVLYGINDKSALNPYVGGNCGSSLWRRAIS